MAGEKHYSPIDMQKLEIWNFIFQNLASAPSSPLPGQPYYDTATGKLMWRNASTWIDPLARANHTGQQPSSSISDFSSAVTAHRLSALAVPNADVAMGGFKITGGANGTAATDFVTKQQLDQAAVGLDWKDSVRAATTANITLSGPQTIDGVSVIAGDRVLVKDQSSALQNGIYLVAAGAWTRTADASSGTLTSGANVPIEEGTQAGRQYRLQTANPITVGTTAQTWVWSNQGQTYTNGSGIAIVGNAIAIDTTIVTRKATFNVGDGVSNTIVCTHNWNTYNVGAFVFLASTHELIDCDVTNALNTTTLGFSTIPTSNQFHALLLG